MILPTHSVLNDTKKINWGELPLSQETGMINFKVQPHKCEALPFSIPKHAFIKKTTGTL